MIEGVIAEYLAAHPDVIAAGIPAYAGGAGGLAIFAVTTPKDCKSLPVNVQSLITGPFDTQGENGFTAQVQVAVYGDKTYSRVALRKVAFTLKKALHRCGLTPFIEAQGHTIAQCTALHPFDHTDEDGFPGCLISVALSAIEK